MTEENDRTLDFIEKLKQQRDELRLQIHLAKAEARDEWDELENKWGGLMERMKAVGEEAGEAKSDIGTAARELAVELKKGYARIMDQI